MIAKTLVTAALASTLFLAPAPQQTPSHLSDSYRTLADAIIALHETENSLIRGILDHHYQMAKMHVARESWREAAAEIALFSSEGDNAVGGVRKRLIEGGHHHHAAAEEKGIFEAGFVVVTRVAKEQGLQIAGVLRKATTQEERDEAWARFQILADALLKSN